MSLDLYCCTTFWAPNLGVSASERALGMVIQTREPFEHDNIQLRVPMARYLLGECTNLIQSCTLCLMPSPGYSLSGSQPDAEHSSVAAEDNTADM